MEKPSAASEAEYSELAGSIDQLAERATNTDSAELELQWQRIERLVLERVDADEQATERAGLPSYLLRSEEQRIRNLSWEVSVSIDLGAVHLDALRSLAEVLRERGRRVRRAA